MKYLTLDTCIWLELLKIDFSTNNVFEEICFWIERGHIVHIVPENIIREWDRNKESKISEIVGSINKLIYPVKDHKTLVSDYQPDKIRNTIKDRIKRVDFILKNLSEIAQENTKIYHEASQRCLNELAPNHSKDSFRDTVNILTIVEYLKKKGYAKSIFSSLNYTDFSESKEKKEKLHHDLEDYFKSVNLEYIYCNESPLGSKLFHYLGIGIPKLLDHLKEKKKNEDERKLEEKKAIETHDLDILDDDFLENIKYIDMIITKVNPTAFELNLIKTLISRHDSYKNYFLRQMALNGVV